MTDTPAFVRNARLDILAANRLGQTLYITEGQGLVQSRGEAIVTIRPGDIVHTPTDEWHWHGAAPDHFMTHLSLTEGPAQWGEHVADAEYQGEQH